MVGTCVRNPQSWKAQKYFKATLFLAPILPFGTQLFWQTRFALLPDPETELHERYVPKQSLGTRENLV